MALNSNFRTLTADNIEGLVDERNYLKSSFENGTTTGWREMTVTLTSGLPTGTPTISSSAAASLALSASSVTPLSGSRSLLVNVPSALTAGEGFISEEFTLDRMDLGKVLTVAFDYERVTGTYNFSGTLGSQTWMVYIYDATLGGANWIQPAGFLGMNQSSGPGRVACTFQSSVTAGQKYRVAVIASQAAAGASSIEFDNFTCSRQTAPIGPVVTDWVSYTPTVTGMGTVSSVFARWRRDGDTLEGHFTFVAGTPTATPVKISLPIGVIDTAKCAVNTVIGKYTATTPGLSGAMIAGSSDLSAVFYGADGTGYTSGYNGSNFSAGSTHGGFFRVPISGWSSQVQLSSDSDTRVVAFYSNTPALTAGSVPVGIMNFTNISIDTHGSYQGSGVYRVPVSGQYVIAVNGFKSTAVASEIYLRLNGIDVNLMSVSSSSTNGSGLHIVTLVAGDLISLRNNTATWVPAVASWVTFEIHRLSGPSVVAASETVAMRAVKNTGAQTASGVTQTVASWTSVVQDTHGIFNATTGVATIPVSGTYLCTFQVQLAANSAGARVTQMYKNGAVGVGSMQAESNIYVSFVDRPVMVGGALLKLNAGDNLRLATYQDGAASLNYSTFDASSTNFNIVRVGN